MSDETITVNLEGKLRQIVKAALLSGDYSGHTEEGFMKLALRDFLSHEAVKLSVFRVLTDSGYTEEEIKMLFKDIGSPAATFKCLRMLDEMNHLTHRKLHGEVKEKEKTEK